jgi:MerR family transcriptional regulator, thiopeptide resistance regulator
MNRWHTEFERRAPEAHHEFLLSLGIPPDEVAKIRNQR